jgi:hypothetical protein
MALQEVDAEDEVLGHLTNHNSVCSVPCLGADGEVNMAQTYHVFACNALDEQVLRVCSFEGGLMA